MFLQLYFVLLIPAVASAFSNDLVSKPEVQCGVDNIIVSMNTLHPFTGRLYVDGESEKDNCVRRTETGSKGLKFDISIGECNMRRQRTLHPRGIAFSFTLVISFHPFFVTGQDRAFNIRCFFLESVKSLNTGLEVGTLTTEVVEQDVPLPMCTYQLRGGINGEKINFAQVGQKVTHVWHCDEEVSHVYGILIHSCFADDGRGNKFQLVDDNGCTTDPMLLPQIEYESDSITAVTHANVFKYADKVQLYFTCTVQLCYKHDGGCDGITPPKCSQNHLSETNFPSEKIAPVENNHPEIPEDEKEMPPNSPPPPPHHNNPNIPHSEGVMKPKSVILPGPNEMSQHFIGSLPEDIQQKAVNSMQFFKNIQQQQQQLNPNNRPNQYETNHGSESHELPYKDSPLNETETDGESPDSEILRSEPFVLPKSVNKVKTSSTLPPKQRRHLKNMEADVTVEMLVLPPETESGKEHAGHAKLPIQLGNNFCVSKLWTSIIIASASTVFLVFITIVTIIIRKQRALLQKYNHLRAFN